MKIVPKVSYCIAFEWMFMFFYVAQTTFCYTEFSTHREHIMAWILLLLYGFIWAKQAYSFFMTFGTIVRDTEIGMRNTIEEALIPGVVSMLLLLASLLNLLLNRDNRFAIYSAIYLFGGFLNGYHSWLLKEFNQEPTYRELERRNEQNQSLKKDS